MAMQIINQVNYSADICTRLNSDLKRVGFNQETSAF